MSRKVETMKVILKPAGLLMITGVFLTVVSFAVAGILRSRIKEPPKAATIDLFQSKTGKKSNINLYDSKETMVVVDLTSVGKSDWVHWGRGGSAAVTRKARTGSPIGTFELLTGDGDLLPAGTERGPSRGFTWRDGTPTSTEKITYDGVHLAKANGFRLRIPADRTEKTAIFYVGGYRSGGFFSAKLSDGTKPTVKVTDIALGSGYYSRAYTVTFRTAASGQDLEAVWKKDDDQGNISLQAVALQ